MMQFDILAVGRLKQEAELKLQSRYIERISKSGPSLGIKSIQVTEFVEAKSQDVSTRKSDEASRMLASLPKGAFLIALDERGKTFSTADFSKQLQLKRDEGHSSLCFALGGPDGHGAELLNQAHMKLSLSPMTLPHGLARVILIEQLYRALTIWSGHPYHRE
ncbi:MAG: ribosomal RNA large subunit methyltransferase H [Methyloligella sp.]|nr:MAG: ribosomal RNA large subunit methyltransferase H [Methyloligella sp.]